jgi:hypothetical protein
LGDKEYRFECINKITKLKKYNETSNNKQLLDLFATYVYWTNPDYKYNETYLKDMIPEFWINVEKYILKIEFREEMLIEIKSIQIPKELRCQLSIQIDDTWELIFDNLHEGSKDGWIRKNL